MGGDHGAVTLGGQLGGPRPSLTRQLRGLRPSRLESEMARGAWVGTLDTLLHRLRRRPTETVLRALPHRRAERLDGATSSAAAGQIRRRFLQGAGRERVAARTDRVDAPLPKPRRGALAGA